MAMSQAQAQAWAEGYLQSIGAPATNANDPRVAFLTAQAMHEATNATNNRRSSPAPNATQGG